MPSSSTSSKSNDTSASSRDHNQGRQTRDYTPAQAAAVNRVRKCQHHEYYAILDIEKSASDAEIKRAYRKLALLMHPDKNGAPGADEAFKMVSKAFQILSDIEKKTVYDSTGVDPDSRGNGMPSGFSRRSTASTGFSGMYGDDISPDELFNMFFGGGGGQAFQASFGGFGGPGVRIHSFGGNPFSSFAQAGRMPRQPPGQQPSNNDFLSLRSLIQLFPLILLFIFPLLSSLFDSSSSSGDNFWRQQTKFEFTPSPPYTAERFTPRYHVPYYLNPKDIDTLNNHKLVQLDHRVETSYIRGLQNKCDIEYDRRQRKLDESQGWFFVDQEKYQQALKMKMDSCDKLKTMGLRLDRR
ncbi:DnaJ domain-containing protein [Dipodascopsis uninucleata]